MNDNENKKSMEELADEALDAVAGGGSDRFAALLGGEPARTARGSTGAFICMM